MKLKILISHNRYLHQGGEDTVVDEEIILLRKHGHEVLLYQRDNVEIKFLSKIRIARDTIWSRTTAHEIDKIIRDFKPDIIHSHNTFPLISPSLYWTANKNNIPIVQTLHNFRLFCLQAMFLRDGVICEDCIGKTPWRGILNKCYRNSVSQSSVLATLLSSHRLLDTYNSKVTRYIALNNFCRDIFIKGGLSPELIMIKPNFTDIKAPLSEHAGNPLFVGRLSPEKGIDILVKAVSKTNNINVDIVGTGPLETDLTNIQGINLHGWQEKDNINELMRNAAYLIMPSIWYETFGLVIIEAFANGLPVIASNIGAMAEIVEDGYTGLLFEHGSVTDLAKKILWAKDNPERMIAMGKNAKKVYELKYTPEINYNHLMHIYKEAITATYN